MKKIVVGKEEWCALPELGLPAIKARVDSGATTSSLHAFNIRPYTLDGEKWVKFDMHPIQRDRDTVVHCRAQLVDTRKVRSSNGLSEHRPVIQTMLAIGGEQWPIQLTLTNRDAMGYRMLLGREAMRGRMMVDPEMSFAHTRLKDQEVEQVYRAMPKPAVKGMRIAVLATNRELYSNQRLMEAGKARGHEMRFINIEYCYMNISAEKPEVHYRGGEVLEAFDAVIPRIRPKLTFYGCAVLRQFANAGAYCLNDALAITRSRDKLRSLQLLSNNNIPMPTTSFANSPQETKELIQMVGGAPLVVKLLEGTQGVGVVLAETNKAAESVINAFKSVRANILVQEFVKEADGKDLRLFLVENKVVGAMQRVAPKGEFRANIHLGGVATKVTITPEEKAIAVAAAKTMGLKVSGVDIIRSASGPKVLEVNNSPGLEGIEGITGKDIAGLMIECIERNARKKRKTKTDG